LTPTSPSKCTFNGIGQHPSPFTRTGITNELVRFVDCEKWRKEFGGGVDKLVPTFDYKEKPQVFKYYPQYYHKTDKVGECMDLKRR